MSPPKKDRKIRSVLRKNFREGPPSEPPAGGRYAATIAAALRHGYGGTHAAVKTVATLTGANERAVKNWFDASNGPNGEFLITLCKHSDQVLETVLALAGRVDLVNAKKLTDARGKLKEMLELMDRLEKGFE